MSDSRDTTQELRRLTLAWFDGAGLTAAPPAWLEKSLFALVPEMPPDLSPESAARAPYRWMRLASVLDFAGDFAGARELLDRLEATAPTRLPATDSNELLALVWARRGRLARQCGEIDAAIGWYERGLSRANGARHLDAWGACVQGLATCAQFRGDLHNAERLSRLVAINHAVVPVYAHVAALLTLAVAYRKSSRTEAALRCAWRAHDLVDERDERRGMALVELSYLALLNGQLGAARRGFSVVLSFARTMRVRRPALSGSLRGALASLRVSSDANRNEVRVHIDALLNEAGNATEQWERLHARFDALEAFLALSEQRKAYRLISELRAEVDLLESRSESVGWAEQRLLQATNSFGVPVVPVETPPPDFGAAATNTVAVALSRLATLQPLPENRRPTLHALAD